MRFENNTAHEVRYAQARSFCQQLNTTDLAHRDQNQFFSRDMWGQLCSFGLTGLTVPKEYGGSGLDAIETMVTLEALGYGCPDEGTLFAANAQLLSTVVALHKFGQPAIKTRFLKDLCSGNKIAAHGITEELSGSNVFNMATTATKTGDGYLLNGKKVFITNAPVADLIMVYAVTDNEKGILGGITPFLIEARRAGVKLSDPVSKMGLRTCMMGSIELDNVAATAEDIVGQAGGGYRIFQDSMNWERIGMSAMIVGIVDRLITDTAAFARHRGLGKHQAVAHPIAAASAQLEAIRSLLYQSATSLGQAPSSAGTTRLASSVKLLASELYQTFASQALHIMGGYGYLTEGKIEMSVRNAAAATLYSGTSEVQKNIIAQLLKV